MTSREEVAARLREGGIARNEKEAYVLLLYCIGIRPQLPAVHTYKSALERLADLIDPTCEVVESPDNEEFMIRVVSGFTCKKCGHTALVNRDCGKWEDPLNYCPNCGARVVNGVPDAEA
nr:MAG TPA: DNA polymerase II large subunit [Caudoviricetes sp.]